MFHVVAITKTNRYFSLFREVEFIFLSILNI